MDLSGQWWLVAALYFAADVILFTTVIAFRNPRPGMNFSPKRPFLHNASEVIPALFMLHLVYLTFEYRVSSRLEEVGLGALEPTIYLGAMITIGAWIFRSFEIAERPETNNMSLPRSERLRHGS